MQLFFSAAGLNTIMKQTNGGCKPALCEAALPSPIVTSPYTNMLSCFCFLFESSLQVEILSSLQVEILFVCPFVCPSVQTLTTLLFLIRFLF